MNPNFPGRWVKEWLEAIHDRLLEEQECPVSGKENPNLCAKISLLNTEIF